MNDGHEKIIKNKLIEVGDDGKRDELRERLVKATGINDQFVVKRNKKVVLGQDEYYEKLKTIIKEDYYPDLNYLRKNKDDYDVIKRSINDLPGTLSQNQMDNAAGLFGNLGKNEDCDFFTLDRSCKDNKRMSISEFQSKYTNDCYVSFLESENRQATKRRDELRWIEEQTLTHNLNREINLINSEARSNISSSSSSCLGNAHRTDLKEHCDQDNLVLTKSEARTAFMFGAAQNNYIGVGNEEQETAGGRYSDSVKINPENTRYRNDESDLLLLNKDRLEFLKDLKKRKQGETREHKNATKLLLKSPLVRNAIKRSREEKKFRYVDHELRSSYSSYKSDASLSRTTKFHGNR